MKQFKTKALLVDDVEIQKVSLDYCSQLLKDRLPKEGYERDIFLKNVLHSVKINVVDNDDTNFTEKEFEEILEDIKIKKKK